MQTSDKRNLVAMLYFALTMIMVVIAVWLSFLPYYWFYRQIKGVKADVLGVKADVSRLLERSK